MYFLNLGVKIVSNSVAPQCWWRTWFLVLELRLPTWYRGSSSLEPSSGCNRGVSSGLYSREGLSIGLSIGRPLSGTSGSKLWRQGKKIVRHVGCTNVPLHIKPCSEDFISWTVPIAVFRSKLIPPPPPPPPSSSYTSPPPLLSSIQRWGPDKERMMTKTVRIEGTTIAAPSPHLSSPLASSLLYPRTAPVVTGVVL